MRHVVAILAVLMAVLTGCATTQSGDASGFAQNTEISALSGVYRNKAEANPTALPPRYLSAFLWRGDKSLSHEAVDAVLVAVKNDALVEAQALGKEGQVMATTRFERGSHFEFKSGLLQVKPHRFKPQVSSRVSPCWAWPKSPSSWDWMRKAMPSSGKCPAPLAWLF